MAQQISCSIWLPYGLVLILMIFCSVTVLITPTESSLAVPLIRQRTDSNASNGNESSISDADVQKRIQEVFNRSRFVFPSDLEPRIDRTECTPDYPVCSNVIDYPQELINEIVGRQKDRYAEVFGNDIVLTDGDKLVQRFDVDENGNSFEFICESRERLIHPRSGFNADNKSIMIVNTNDYMQGVRIETCSTQGQPCEKLNPLFGKTECRQLFHYRTLLAIDPKTNQP